MAAQGDLSAASEITDLTVEYISVVDKPATGKTFTLKAEDGRPLRGHAFALVKSDDELQVLYGIVYPADTIDAHGQWASAATIRKAMERFMRNALTGNVDKQHNFSKQDAWVAESWIIRKGDPLFPDEPAGSWAAGIKVLDPDLWRACKAEKYTGFSLAGFGEVMPPADQPQPGWVNKFLKTLESLVSKKEDTTVPITSEEQTAIAKSVVELLKAEGLIKSAPPGSAVQPVQDGELLKSVQALAKAVEGLPNMVSDAVAKAVAKGAVEGAPEGADRTFESFM